MLQDTRRPDGCVEEKKIKVEYWTRERRIRKRNTKERKTYRKKAQMNDSVKKYINKEQEC